MEVGSKRKRDNIKDTAAQAARRLKLKESRRQLNVEVSIEAYEALERLCKGKGKGKGELISDLLIQLDRHHTEKGPLASLSPALFALATDTPQED